MAENGRGHAGTLVHRAFLYDSRDAFVAGMAPFLREGLEAGDVLFAATTRANADALREALGDGAEAVDFHDSEDWYVRPAETLDAYRRVADGVPAGKRLRAVGEVAWRGTDAGIREWARYESVLDVALARDPVSVVCPYDAAALPDAILEHAERTHSELHGVAGARPSESFVRPDEFPLGLAPRERPHEAVELPLDGEKGLSELRRLVSARARDAGVAGERLHEVVFATSEVAANALRHGRPPVVARIAADGRELVCEVVDRGAGIDDPLAGWMRPGESAGGGWGLVLARRLCDAVEIDSGEAGSTVSLHFELRSRRRSA